MCSNGGSMRSSTWRSSSPEAPTTTSSARLSRLGRHLAHETAQALHVTLERDHARAHESVLQFRDDARLLQQQVLRFARQVLEQALDAADVAHGFGERARELLDGRIAIELERIEVLAPRMLFLMPMQDLRFGLELELAQLILEARHRAAELGEVELDRAHLLLETRAEDAHFAGVVEQRVEQVGVDAREFLAFLRLTLATRQRRRLRFGAASSAASGGSSGDSAATSSVAARRAAQPATRLFDAHGLARRSGAEFIGAELDVEIDGLVGASICAGAIGCRTRRLRLERLGQRRHDVRVGAASSLEWIFDVRVVELPRPERPARRRGDATAQPAQASSTQVRDRPARGCDSSVRAPARNARPASRHRACGAARRGSPAGPRRRFRLAGTCPPSTSCMNVSSSWLRSPMARMPAMRAPPFSVCTTRFSSNTSALLPRSCFHADKRLLRSLQQLASLLR